MRRFFIVDKMQYVKERFLVAGAYCAAFNSQLNSL